MVNFDPIASLMVNFDSFALFLMVNFHPIAPLYCELSRYPVAQACRVAELAFHDFFKGGDQSDSES